MELSSLFGLLTGPWVDDVMVWTVAALAGIIGVVAVVNALDLLFEAEAG